MESRSKSECRLISFSAKPVIPLCAGLVLALLQSPLASAQPLPLEGQSIGDETLRRWLVSESFTLREHAVLRLAENSGEAKAYAESAQIPSGKLYSPALCCESAGNAADSLPEFGSDSSPGRLAAASIPTLVDDLTSATQAIRHRAGQCLEILATQSGNGRLILDELKQRLNQAELSPSDRRELEDGWDLYFGLWLAQSEASEHVPNISTDELEDLLDQLIRKPDAGNASLLQSRASTAERELRLLLAHDSLVDSIKEALERRLANDDLTVLARERITRLHDLTRPGLSAEIWSFWGYAGVQPGYNIQYLWVDVPQMPDRATRATHFDRVNDKTAHLTTGSNLTEGDYPVGRLFPWEGQNRNLMLFHLVNLPTPRRWMAFEYASQDSGVKRLAMLTRPSLKKIIAEKEPLTEFDGFMLSILDRNAARDFALDYLESVDDAPITIRSRGNLEGPAPSSHLVLCEFLAGYGDVEAAIRLVAAIDKGRVGRNASGVDFAWLAVLSILSSDSSTSADALLYRLAHRNAALIPNEPDAADLGATAAALLMIRKGIPPEEYGLEAVDLTPYVHGGWRPHANLTAYVHRFIGDGSRSSVDRFLKRIVAVDPSLRSALVDTEPAPVP